MKVVKTAVYDLHIQEDLILGGFRKVSSWQGFIKLQNPEGRVVILAPTKSGPFPDVELNDTLCRMFDFGLGDGDEVEGEYRLLKASPYIIDAINRGA